MVLVAQEDGVDVGKLVDFQGRAVVNHERRSLGCGVPSAAGRREEWVGEEGDAINVENCCGGSDMSHANLVFERRGGHDCKCLRMRSGK